MPIFGLVIGIDISMLLLSPKYLGGVDLLLFLREDTVCGWVIWYSLMHSLWLTWFALIVLSSMKLQHDRVGWWWIIIPTLSCFTFIAIILSAVGVYNRRWFRLISHGAIEPFLLLWGSYLLIQYSVKSITKGKPIDIFALYLRLSVLCCAMKTLLALRPDYTTVRHVSHALYYTTFGIFITAYLLDKIIATWVAQL
jgi:hypothetical protein